MTKRTIRKACGRSVKFHFASAAYLIANAYSVNAIAQDDAPIMLEEIIVTAQKRPQNLQDVPVAVSVMSGEKLANAGIQDLQELGPYVPNFFQASTPTANLIFIRGIGSGDNPSFEQSVGVFHDGIYWGRGRQTLSPLYDLDRIEVLKGPQGVLYGKNVIAGAVRSLSARPTDEFSGNVMMSNGSFDEQKTEAAFSGGLTDSIRARLALHYQESDGWVKNAFTEKDEPTKETSGIRLGLEFDVSDNLMAYVKMEWNSFELIGHSYELVKSTTTNLTLDDPSDPFNAANVDLPQQLSGDESSFDGRSNWGNSTMPGQKGAEFYTDFINHLVQLDWDVEDYTVTSVTGISSYKFKGLGDLDISKGDILGVLNNEDYRQYSQELRIQSPIGEGFEYQAGIYLQSSELDWDTDVHMKITNLFDGVLPAFVVDQIRDTEGVRETVYDLSANSASAFFEGTFNLSEVLRIKFGGRYTYEKKEVEKDVLVRTFNGTVITAADTAKDANGNYIGTDTLEPAFILTALDLVWQPNLEVYPYYFKDERTESQFTPQITVEWNATEDAMVYGSATRGFKGGGYDTNHADGTQLGKLEYEEETALSFELGLKASLMDNRMELNAALYHTQFDDLQVSIYNGTSAFNVSNAGEATSEGLEIEGRFMATASLEVKASIAWTHYVYDDYKNGQCTVSNQADELLSVSASNTDPNRKMGDITKCAQDLTGKDAMLSPDKIASLSLTHFQPVSTSLMLVSTLDANYTDEYFLSADLDPATLQNNYTKWNARISLIDDSGWQIALMVKNITNEDTLSSSEDIPFGNGNAYGSTICAAPTTPKATCSSARSQLADREGSFYGVTDSPRRYILEARYQF